MRTRELAGRGGEVDAGSKLRRSSVNGARQLAAGRGHGFVLLANGDVARDILPGDLASLRLDERALKSLLFSRSPEQTFAGLLHTRGLIGLSPYDTSGAVKEEQMFFGRVADLRELLLATSVQHLIVGPRRVGKTSLLRRLLPELPKRRPDAEAVFLDLLGISDHTRAARALARALKVEMPEPSPGIEPEVALVEILRRRFDASGKKAVILIDEADGLIEADARLGFPLLSAMRALQAEEACSFVLAGYLYLYREAMNQRSPLYNFATVRILGPLDSEAGRDLATLPMQRLGVEYTDAALPARIVERTGGYPSFVQLLCDAVLKELTDGDLAVTAADVDRAEKGPLVASKLGDIFRLNAGKIAQIAVYSLLDRDAFDADDVDRSLRAALGRAATTDEIDQALLELRLFGFLVEREGRFTWAIPLLSDTLRAAAPDLTRARLVDELRAAPGERG